MEAGRTRPGARVMLATAASAVVLLAAACGSVESPSPTPVVITPAPTVAPTPAPPSAATASGTPRPTPGPTPVPTATTLALEHPLSASGRVVVQRADGSLWILDPDGAYRPFAGPADGRLEFPTWSPDGTRVAAIRTGQSDPAILVIDLAHATEGAEPEPQVIFQSSTIGPFYLSWTPDGKGVSFLANEGGGLSLRLAAADGSSPLDGSGPGAVIRQGSPLYFDWIDPQHLYAHIGDGPDAFLGEIGADGQAVGASLPGPGPFRAVDVSEDGRYVAYVGADTDGKNAIVVADRDGGARHSMPVFDIGAVDFSPTNDLVASIGSITPVTQPVGFPIGPLRVMDAGTGKVRTLLDGNILGFSWSPDGKTIAAIRFEDVPVPATSASAGASTGASAAPTTETEIHLTFVDVASGTIRSDPEARPSPSYVNAILAYFDQYALSHQAWAPDSSSLLLPILGDDGDEHIAAFDPDGGEPVVFDGILAFWTPDQH